MGRADRYTNSEADAGRYDRAVYGEDPETPTLAELEAEERES